MKLHSMKLSTSISSEKVAAEPTERPAFPWGLSINLGKDELEKLGLKDDLPEVGSTMKLEAKVSVTSVSENKSLGGGDYCNVTLQITAMGLSSAKAAEDELYT